MKEKLLKYGFPEWQIDILLKKKKVSTGHGEYILKSDKLELHARGTKEVVLSGLTD